MHALAATRKAHAKEKYIVIQDPTALWWDISVSQRAGVHLIKCHAKVSKDLGPHADWHLGGSGVTGPCALGTCLGSWRPQGYRMRWFQKPTWHCNRRWLWKLPAPAALGFSRHLLLGLLALVWLAADSDRSHSCWHPLHFWAKLLLLLHILVNFSEAAGR